MTKLKFCLVLNGKARTIVSCHWQCSQQLVKSRQIGNSILGLTTRVLQSKHNSEPGLPRLIVHNPELPWHLDRNCAGKRESYILLLSNLRQSRAQSFLEAKASMLEPGASAMRRHQSGGYVTVAYPRQGQTRIFLVSSSSKLYWYGLEDQVPRFMIGSLRYNSWSLDARLIPGEDLGPGRGFH